LFLFGAVKEGVCRRGLDPFFFFLTMYLIGRQKELKCCLLAEKLIYKRFCMKKGFTLIELLVVVLIIGILSAVALPQYTKAVQKARAVEAITILKSLTDAQEIYYMENGEYTTVLEDLSIDVPEQTDDYNFACPESHRSCFAHGQHGNATFEFYLKNADGNLTYRGKHWCLASSAENHAFCKTFGPLDWSSTTIGYYLIN